MTADRSNPDFWHHMPKDDAWKDVTLSTMERLNHRLQPICRACWHKGGIMTPAEVAELFDVPKDIPLLTIERMLRCAACGLPAGYFYQQSDDQAARVIGPGVNSSVTSAWHSVLRFRVWPVSSGAGLLLCSPPADGK